MKKVVVFAGLLATSHPSSFAVENTPTQTDMRFYRLKAFFEACKCPVSRFAMDFLDAADEYKLDWRLLPSISVIESGGGKAFRGNNIFGWGSQTEFSSIREAIHWVAQRLAKSRLYRHKELDDVLKTYNPRPEYSAKVKSVMRRLDPTQPLADAGFN